VAFSTALLASGLVFKQDNPNWWIYALLSFFATFSVYNGQRLFKSNQPVLTPWLEWVKRNERSIFLMVASSSIVASIFLFAILEWKRSSLLILSISAIFSSFYVIKIFGKNLREIPHIKIHLISLTWVLFLVVFPMLNEGMFQNVIETTACHYIYILAVTIPFDIRDLKYDAKAQKTFPQLIGINASKALSVVLLGVFMTLLPMVQSCLLWNVWFYISVLIQIALVIGMNENRTDLYCAGFIDGAIGLLGLSYFLC
jgi:4-hydroxybenzoate polyprenyltransferase